MCGTIRADLGLATEDGFLAQNINAPVPEIAGAHMVLSGHRTSDFVLHFSLPMDPASVQNLNAYELSDTITHHSGGLLGYLLQGFENDTFSSSVELKTATYNPTTNTVDLHLAQSVDARDVYQITNDVYDNLLDAAGTPINVNGGFTITLGNKKATISTQ